MAFQNWDVAPFSSKLTLQIGEKKPGPASWPILTRDMDYNKLNTFALASVRILGCYFNVVYNVFNIYRVIFSCIFCEVQAVKWYQ